MRLQPRTRLVSQQDSGAVARPLGKDELVRLQARGDVHQQRRVQRRILQVAEAAQRPLRRLRVRIRVAGVVIRAGTGGGCTLRSGGKRQRAAVQWGEQS